MNRNNITDIRRLCTGWIATYHVWKLEKPNDPAAKVDIVLDAEDVIHPLRKYLDHPITAGLDFPLAIAPDATSFCILRIVYIIRMGGKSQLDTKIFSQRFSTATPAEVDIAWSAPREETGIPLNCYSFHFSPKPQFLVLHEYDQDGSHLVVFKCSHDSQMHLVWNKMNELGTSSQTEMLEHLTFHPSCTVLAFCGRLPTKSFRKENVVFSWDFKKSKSILRELLFVCKLILCLLTPLEVITSITSSSEGSPTTGEQSRWRFHRAALIW